MPNLHTIKMLRACVVNRAPRSVGEIVEEVPTADQIALCARGKAELVTSAPAAEVIAAKKEAAKKAAKAAKKAPAKKAAKKD
jgi:hypothetical protein